MYCGRGGGREALGVVRAREEGIQTGVATVGIMKWMKLGCILEVEVLNKYLLN